MITADAMMIKPLLSGLAWKSFMNVAPL